MSGPIRVTVWNEYRHERAHAHVAAISGGEVFRSGCCFRRGAGRIFYLGAGHQEWPVFHQPEIRQVLANAVCRAHGDDGERSVPRAPLHAEAGWSEQARRGV